MAKRISIYTDPNKKIKNDKGGKKKKENINFIKWYENGNYLEAKINGEWVYINKDSGEIKFNNGLSIKKNSLGEAKKTIENMFLKK